MNKFYSASVAVAFAGAGVLAGFAGTVQAQAAETPSLSGAAPAIALADRDDHAKPPKADKHAGDPNYFLQCKAKKHDRDDQKCTYKKIKPPHHGRAYPHPGPGRNATMLTGNIVAVGNGTVTLLGVPPVVINVQQAVNNNATNGALSIGRHITAYGYYSNNIFYATSIQ